MVKIILDPGHNKAKYNQSPVVPEYFEGAQMWKLYNHLRTALEKKGFIVGSTKSKCDQTVSVTQRGYMAKGNDALISLHSNACGTESVDRPVGIYFTDDDCSSIDLKSKVLAQKLSGVVEKVMGTSPAQQYSRLSDRDRDGDGKKNDDYYGVLYAAHQSGVPAIILECSFHTNTRAAKWLLDDVNLKKLAQALADELADYYGMVEVTTPKKDEFEVNVSVLKKGDKGNQVKAMQILLIGFGFSCGSSGADGSFGSATDKAVRAYQKANGLTVDGSVGPKTWAKLLGV